MSSDNDAVKFRITAPGYSYAKWRFVVPMLINAVAAATLIMVPTAVGAIISEFAAGNVTAALRLLMFIVLSLLLQVTNEKTTFAIIMRLQFEVIRDWRNYIFQLIKKTPKQVDPGEVISVVVKDSKSIAMLLFSFPDAAGSVVVAVVGTVQLWLISPALAVTALSGIILAGVALSLISKLLEKRGTVRRQRTGENAARATDIATSLRTIAGLGAGAEMRRRHRDAAHNLRNANVAYARVAMLTTGARLTLVGITTLLAVGMALTGNLVDGVWRTNVEPSQLVAVAGTVALMVGPIWTFEMMLVGYRETRVALRRIKTLEQKQYEKPAALAELTVPAEILAGQQLVYVDPRSAGLSAQEYAESLAAKMREQQRGRVLLSQSNPTIFAGSLRSHLTCDELAVSDADLTWMLELTDSLEIAHRLGGADPAEYFAAEISSEGANLSGGQRQRLALARALLQPAAVLICAEPLNSVDEPSQKYIFDRLEQELGSHRLLQHLRQVIVVSTTSQVQNRVAAAQAAATAPGTATTTATATTPGATTTAATAAAAHTTKEAK
ncbi:ATP-binding cassette domain-containing protein [Canibacter oris]|uniref:ABC-type multidrug transport system fused ATPase/permease subunit n=1 Tax=Canibacter oris TaxID=1365628 RepID=A0A840DI52_9MICO|nr:ABC transporter ATP-binding protein [Canibacter oris]MBB4071455.1 ABC-type multidrug transport system fused ATPase/permease subunit [Canibacter oris]